MKTCLAQTTLLFILLLGAGSVKAQTTTPQKETNKTESPVSKEDQKYSDSKKFDEVKLQILEVTKELNLLGVTAIPEYPKYIDLKSVTAYLEELEVLKTRYSQINSGVNNNSNLIQK